MCIFTGFSENNIGRRDIYHTASISWASGHYNQVQFSSVLFKRLSQTVWQ